MLDKTVSLPWHERTAAVAAIYSDEGKAPELARYWTGARGTLTIFQSHQAVLRCMLIAIAAERHRLRHGAWPGSTAELVSAFLPELPLDPFNGQELRYKRLPDGIVIYSVGADGTDEGGQISPTPTQQSATDIGVRLWDVRHRRQPPPVGEKQR